LLTQAALSETIHWLDSIWTRWGTHSAPPTSWLDLGEGPRYREGTQSEGGKGTKEGEGRDEEGGEREQDSVLALLRHLSPADGPVVEKTQHFHTSWKVLGFFCEQESGNPEDRQDKALEYL